MSTRLWLESEFSENSERDTAQRFSPVRDAEREGCRICDTGHKGLMPGIRCICGSDL